MYIAFVSGIILPIFVGVCAMVIGLDRDRAFYPTVMCVIACIYVLFAAMSGEVRTVIPESLIAVVFLIVATMGFTRNSWWVVLALAAHGTLDVFHGSIVSNSGVPVWWPAFCATYDIVAAGFLAWTLRRDPSRSQAHRVAGHGHG
jgi:hypothetical protein